SPQGKWFPGSLRRDSACLAWQLLHHRRTRTKITLSHEKITRNYGAGCVRPPGPSGSTLSSSETAPDLVFSPLGRAPPQVVFGLDLDRAELSQRRNQTGLGEDVQCSALVRREVEIGGRAQQDADDAVAAPDASHRASVAVDPAPVVVVVSMSV